MANRKTLNFLPEIFRSDTNKKFLGATLDQLISEPSLGKVDGFVGRKFSPTFIPSNNYIIEPTADRQNYQFEPAVVVKNASNGLDLYSDYKDLIDKISYYGGITNNQDRLFRSEYYSYTPRIDLDKFVNYTRYYWLPDGPDAVTLTAGTPATPKTFNVSKVGNSYRINESGNNTVNSNPDITLVRGVTYRFTGSPGFWIQTEPGTDGLKDYNTHVSSRRIFGVTNNGGQNVTFTVPARDAQDYYLASPLIDYIDFIVPYDPDPLAVTNKPFSNIDGSYLGVPGGTDSIDGSNRYAVNACIVFMSTSTDPNDWVDRDGNIVPVEKRHGIWRITVEFNGKITLVHVRDIDVGDRIRPKFGNHAGNEFFKSTNGQFVQSSQVTAPMSVLYYQDGTNSAMAGKINIVDRPGTAINVDTDIIGRVSYTSHNGITLSNGMKVQFDSTITPGSYYGKSYIVEGVGVAIKLVDFDTLVPLESNAPETGVPFDTVEFDMGPFDEPIQGEVLSEYIIMNRACQDNNAWARTNRWFHEDVIAKTAQYNGTTISDITALRAQRPILEFEADLQLFNTGRVSLGIIDRADTNIVTLSDSSTWNKITDAFAQINNKSVLEPTIRYMNYLEGQLVIFPNETDAGIRKNIYRIGFKDQTQTIVYDGTGTGILNTVAGSTKVTGGTNFRIQLSVGSNLYEEAGGYIGKIAYIINESTLILESPAPANLVGQIFKFNKPRIELLLYKTAVSYDSVAISAGPNKKKSYWFDGTNWILSQIKSARNQEPLFDVVDAAGNSFGDKTVYTKSEFEGTKIFSYKRGSSALDTVLGLRLSYSNIGNSIADINFNNNFETDTFIYWPALPESKSVSSGYLRKNLSRTDYDRVNVWATVSEPSKQYQHITAKYNGQTRYFEIDIVPATETREPNIKVFVNNIIIDRNSFSIETIGVRRAVFIETLPLEIGDSIDILIYSKEISLLGYSQIPANLEFNALNQSIETITLGQVRGHWYTIGRNTPGVVGEILSSNNLRDLDTRFQSGSILQHSAPTIYGSLFLIDNQINFMNGIELARRDYTKFKNKFLELCLTLTELDPNDPMSGVDIILKTINSVKNSTFAWHYSDMVPWSENYVSDTYRIVNTNLRSYSIANGYATVGEELYPSSGLTNKAVLVYLNGTQLTVGKDYTLLSGSPTVSLKNTVTLATNDILTIKTYRNTDGSYVPETPTKLGLAPRYQPGIYTDNTYRNPVQVIQGHDGSITPVFNDLRDTYLLELEKRIYNNIKVDYSTELFDINSVIPGWFRDNDYSITEFNKVVTTEFLKWSGSNQVDFSSNDSFEPNDQFTWNYNRTTGPDGETMLGYWRGIYKYFYDTDRPHTHPWEMLGLTIKPDWWNSTYGAAPYSSSNSMWADLEQGYIRGSDTTASIYARPGLSKYIPVDTNGNLLPPQEKLIRNFDGKEFSQSYSVGDHGPVESAWRRSSEYPYALQRAMALLKPARYFGLLFDVTAYSKDIVLDQYILQSNKRVSPTIVPVNGETVDGNTTRAISYINWIHGYLTSLGLNAANKIRNVLDNLDVKLGYKVAGYTDKKYITALVEQFSPTSTNQSVIIPDENYIVHLNKSVPIRRATYSAVIVEKTTTGYSVSGYNIKNPYFTVIPSEFNGNSYTIEVLTARASVFQDFKTQKVSVPYGYEFSNKQQVVDFLVGYQRYLISQGFVFNKYDVDLKQTGDWILSAREFLTWSLQGWNPGNVIVLSPISNSLTIFGIDAVVDGITNLTTDSQVLGPNFNAINLDEITVLREPSLTTVTSISGQTIAYADLNLVQFEHALVFDNVTVFNDIVYKPELGSRQYRLKLIGSKTTNWTGELSPPGFIYQTGKIDNWQPERDYVKADIVRYKNQNYTAVLNIPGSATFNFDEWSVLDSQIESGLVANFATNASKFNDIYDIDSQSLDENFDKFSNGLIGYRSRPYLEDLGMDQTTQSKFYQGYIKSKGTKNSIASLFSGQFDSLSNSLSMYEEWGLRVGEYGAIRSNQSIELVVDEADYTGNPVTFKFLNSGDQSTDLVKTLRPKDLSNRPLNYKSPIFLNRELGETDETDVKSAGYVNINEIDAQLFDFSNYTDLTATTLSSLATGYKIWVAKDFDDEWQVYKVIKTSNTVKAMDYSLDNKAKITMAHDHGLQIGDVFAIREFATGVDGFYQVLNVETSNTLVCIIPDALITVLLRDNIESNGELFTLQKSRYHTIQDRDDDITKNFRTTGDRVWVDNDGSNVWAVYDYQSGSAGNFSGSQSFWGIEDKSITLRATGLPYHSFGNVSQETTATAQYYNRTWPLNAGSNVAATTSTITGSGVIGFWLNGVAIVSPDLGSTTPEGYMTVPGLTYNLGYAHYNFDVDLAGGITGTTGQYYYYGYNFTRAWANGSGATNLSTADSDSNSIRYLNGSLAHDNGHSKIIGFALDGYPIYGPYGYTNSGQIRRMITGYALKDSSYRESTEACDIDTFPMGMFIEDYVFDGQGDLDKHNGRYCVTPDYPYGTYAYFTTIDSTGAPTYPYVVGPTYYGPVPEVGNSLIGGQGQKPMTFMSMSDVTWTLTSTQTETVDINSIASMYLFDNVNKTILMHLDFIDPRKGKVLGTAQADLDFVSTFDPAKYNQGTIEELPIEDDYHWGDKQLGMIWWDIDAVRYYDYEQGTLDYRIEYWGKTFPGSSIHVYEWIESDFLPSDYVGLVGDGEPKYSDNSAYVTSSYVDSNTGVVKVKYYYWVRNKVSNTTLSKSHSVAALADIIANPLNQNIPYMAALKDNSIALYNIGSYLSGTSTSLHIDYRVQISENIIHSEYDLFQQGNEKSVMHPRIENKLIDSIVGSDELGNRVPDPSLLPGDRIGLSNKPRQSLIINRLKAVDNIVTFVNTVLKANPITSRLVNKDLIYSDNFFAEEALPAESRYDYAVDSFDQISYVAATSPGSFVVGKQYTILALGSTDWNVTAGTSNKTYSVGSVFTAATVGAGSGSAIATRILVKQDSNYKNRWAIYISQTSGIPELLTLQTYNTKNYWDYQDWYATGYNSKTLVINYTVEKYHDIYTLNLVSGDVVKVTDNSAGLFEIYRVDENSKLELIALEKGTIQLSPELKSESGFDTENFDINVFDYNTFNEFRYILKGLKEDIFVKDLEIYYNQLLFFVIEYILSEQKYVDWIFKTSFVSISHKLEGLIQTTSYVKDRQAFYESFIKEVKPYRTKIREYSMTYSKTETLDSATVTDFDLPAYYDQDIETFRSPNGNFPKDSYLLSSRPEYQDWNNHHKYEIGDIVLNEKGYGHLTSPDISIISTDSTGQGATAKSIINTLDGSILSVAMVNVGRDYTSTPLVVVTGTGSSPTTANYKPSSASVRMVNNKVRKVNTTLRFDRIQYSSVVTDWRPGVIYPSGSYVSYQGQGYLTTTSAPASSTFDKTYFSAVRSDAFTNANDRINAFYSPTAGMIPKILNRLMTGLDNPQVTANVTVSIDTAVQGGGFTGTAIPAGQFVPGERYIITFLGDTNWVSIGAITGRVGSMFTATAAGSGTGEAAIAISSDAFANISGIAAESITVNGGAFVYDIFSHAPEELLPGITYDTLAIKVKERLSNAPGASEAWLYRRFIDMNKSREISIVINPNTTTTLVQPLDVNDTEITVADGSVLPIPNLATLTPGVIDIGAERIEYYIKNGNTLGQIRRGVGGTSTPMKHPIGAHVESLAVTTALYT
jgi:hypothetical protein